MSEVPLRNAATIATADYVARWNGAAWSGLGVTEVERCTRCDGLRISSFWN